MQKHLLVAVLVLSTCTARAANYYLDAVGGQDTSPGTAETTAWKTLDKANEHTFAPGDAILLKAGGTWVGTLHPKGSGTATAPIRIDRYGVGPKPALDGAGVLNTGVVSLRSQSYWEINNLDVKNDAAAGGNRQGIVLSGSSEDGALFAHLVVRGCDIHDVKGIADRSNAAKGTGGIKIKMSNPGGKVARFDDVLIENCTITKVDDVGIVSESAGGGKEAEDAAKADDKEGPDEPNGGAAPAKGGGTPYPGTPEWVARRFSRVVIRNNQLHDIGRNAMIIRFTDQTCLIERNVCWDTDMRAESGNTIFSRSCYGTVFQYNEGYLNHAHSSSGADGSLYDADLESPGCIFQYSYSHDNSAGLFWQCTDPRDTNVIVRYNVSQNDKGAIFCVNYPNTSTFIYNNTVYIGEGVSPMIISERRKNSKMRNYVFSNNVIYNLSKTASYKFFEAKRVFDHNLFFGNHPPGEPADPHKLLADPLLVAPGSAAVGLSTLKGYQLRNSSPCVRAGAVILSNGGFDLWHNPVPAAMAPDIGANQLTKR